LQRILVDSYGLGKRCRNPGSHGVSGKGELNLCPL
jgi:hypothetical protein